MKEKSNRAKNYDVQAVVKASRILEAFEDAEELSLSDLAERTGIPKPSVFRFVATLEGLDLLKQTRNGTYELGLQLVSLARRVLARGFPRVARRFAEDVRQTCGHTVNIAVFDGGEVLFVDVLESQHNFRMVAPIGDRQPLHATAVGKAVAAALSADELDRVLARHPLRPLTPNTITSRAQLDKELDQTRSRGYAIDPGEYQLGAHCIGAAAFDQHGVVGGLSTSAPSEQLPEEDFPATGAVLREAASRLSEALGAGPDHVHAGSAGEPSTGQSDG